MIEFYQYCEMQMEIMARIAVEEGHADFLEKIPMLAIKFWRTNHGRQIDVDISMRKNNVRWYNDFDLVDILQMDGIVTLNEKIRAVEQIQKAALNLLKNFYYQLGELGGEESDADD